MSVDGDDPAHVQWIYDKAKERADSFNIQGVTYRLTQGEHLKLGLHEIATIAEKYFNRRCNHLDRCY